MQVCGLRKSFKIPFPDEIPEGTSEATGNITWNPEKTTVTGAYLEVTGVLHVGGATILFPVRGAIEIFVNGVSLEGFMGGTCVFDCTYPFSVWKDMITALRNGANIVEIKVYKSFGWPTWVKVENLSVFIHVDFEGEDPKIDVKPPPPEWWPYVKYGLIGVGAVATMVFVVPPLIKALRKKS